MSSCLSMMEARLPPGFRFHPRDEELVCDYLGKKISGDNGTGSSCGFPTMIDVDLNKVEPWDLPEIACVGGKEWYFYSLRDRKYATGQRTNRATAAGYWKATGKDRHISRKGTLVGMRKTLVFYQGRAPKGRKTDWVMHEFRMEVAVDAPRFAVEEGWVLCRVFYKSRCLSSKPSVDTNNYQYEDRSYSSSLPPLMETYITFGQTPMSLEGYEQVPCFSKLLHQSSPATASLRRANPPAPAITAFKNHGARFELDSGFNQFDCDKKVIREVLSQLTKLEGSQEEEPHPNLGEGSIESYLSQNGLSFFGN
ncbi:uncharacterized protein A4U43_C06F340 [Asparagus officinalis]|uniref:NAC domain-containing protein n=1 Tax=Asparagus officinalis TaxID=4686 RepID=A0A5P1ENX0_ASPOF|nr:NAC domain-containing protein 21/22-like [Asparagus officinalis]ONK65730.1 uncharacterized protein A4U43_C06F340 [Asparagus officinalis]